MMLGCLACVLLWCEYAGFVFLTLGALGVVFVGLALVIPDSLKAAMVQFTSIKYGKNFDDEEEEKDEETVEVEKEETEEKEKEYSCPSVLQTVEGTRLLNLVEILETLDEPSLKNGELKTVNCVDQRWVIIDTSGLAELLFVSKPDSNGEEPDCEEGESEGTDGEKSEGEESEREESDDEGEAFLSDSQRKQREELGQELWMSMGFGKLSLPVNCEFLVYEYHTPTGKASVDERVKCLSPQIEYIMKYVLPVIDVETPYCYVSSDHIRWGITDVLHWVRNY